MSTAEIEVFEAFTSIGVTSKRDALADVSGVNVKLAVLTWMVGFNLALTFCDNS